MAGLVAAAEARARGADVVVVEKGDRAGGSMLLSSGVVWRHRDFERFRAECPGGRPELQRLRVRPPGRGPRLAGGAGRAGDRARDGQPAHHGRRFDPGADRRAGRAAGGVRLRRAAARAARDAPVVLATGGFARLARARARARDARGGAAAAPGRAVERRATGCGWPRGGRVAERGDGRVLRARHARAARADRASATSWAGAALRAARDGDQRARRALRRRAPGRRSTLCSGSRASRARAACYRVEPRAPWASGCASAPWPTWSRPREAPARRSAATATTWWEVARGDHDDARRPARRRPRRGGAGRLGGGRRRGRHRHRRLRERAGGRAGARARGGRGRARWRGGGCMDARLRQPAFTVGIEEELLLVDPARARARARRRGRASGHATPAGAAGHEAFAAELELRSPPCAPSRRPAPPSRRAGGRAAAGATPARRGRPPGTGLRGGHRPRAAAALRAGGGRHARA